MVILETLLAAVVAAVNVSVVEPDPVTVVGAKLAVTPVGRPGVRKLTTPVNDPAEVTVTVNVVEEPLVRTWLAGDADIEKLFKFNTTVVVCVIVPSVPVIVRR